MTFFQNPDFVEYVRLLGRLHRLIREGRDESVEGEALRDSMDRPGDALSGAEVRAVKDISVDLYSISGDVSEAPTTQAGPFAVLHEVEVAIARRDALGALAILRDHADEFSPASLTFLRGKAFEAVQQFEIAADFFERAKELSPCNSESPPRAREPAGAAE